MMTKADMETEIAHLVEEIAISNRARMSLCAMVGIPYQIDWLELVARVEFELSKAEEHGITTTEGASDE